MWGVGVSKDVLQAIEIIESIEPAQPVAEIPAEALVAVEELTDPLMARRLERARNLLDQGSIVWRLTIMQ